MIILHITKNNNIKKYIINDDIKKRFPNLIFFEAVEFNNNNKINNILDENNNIIIMMDDDDFDQDIFDTFSYPLLLAGYEINSNDNITIYNIEAINDQLLYLGLIPMFKLNIEILPNNYQEFLNYFKFISTVKVKILNDIIDFKQDKVLEKMKVIAKVNDSYNLCNNIAQNINEKINQVTIYRDRSDEVDDTDFIAWTGTSKRSLPFDEESPRKKQKLSNSNSRYNEYTNIEKYGWFYNIIQKENYLQLVPANYTNFNSTVLSASELNIKYEIIFDTKAKINTESNFNDVKNKIEKTLDIKIYFLNNTYILSYLMVSGQFPGWHAYSDENWTVDNLEIPVEEETDFKLKFIRTLFNELLYRWGILADTNVYTNTYTVNLRHKYCFYIINDDIGKLT